MLILIFKLVKCANKGLKKANCDLNDGSIAHVSYICKHLKHQSDYYVILDSLAPVWCIHKHKNQMEDNILIVIIVFSDNKALKKL